MVLCHRSPNWLRQWLETTPFVISHKWMSHLWHLAYSEWTELGLSWAHSLIWGQEPCQLWAGWSGGDYTGIIPLPSVWSLSLQQGSPGWFSWQWQGPPDSGEAHMACWYLGIDHHLLCRIPLTKASPKASHIHRLRTRAISWWEEKQITLWKVMSWGHFYNEPTA